MVRVLIVFLLVISSISCGNNSKEKMTTPESSTVNGNDEVKEPVQTTDPSQDLEVVVNEKDLAESEPDPSEKQPIIEPPTVSHEKPVIVHVEATESHIPKITEIEKISSDVRGYTKSLNDREFTKALSFVNPKVFSITDEEELLATFELMQVMDIKSELMSVDSLSEIIEVGKDEFCKVYFKNRIDMAIPPETANNPAELVKTLKSAGAENVKISDDSKRLIMNRNATLLAAKYGSDLDWKYLDLDPRSADVFGSIFPEEINNQLLK